MSRKDDMIAALQRKEPASAVPIWELSFQAWDAVSGKHMVLGKEFEALTAAEQEKALHANAEIMIEIAVEMHWSAVTLPNRYWYQAPGDLAYFVLPGDVRFEQAAIMRKLAPADLMLVGGNVNGVISADYSEEFCEAMFENPELVDEKVAATLEYGLNTAKRYRDAGVDIVYSASDIADNSGPFFNPRQMDRWIYPPLRRWADEVHAMGMFAILHSDGNLMPVLDGLANGGMDALQAIDTVAGMDMTVAKQKVAGRLCLCGNIDCGLLLTSTPQAVFEATKQLLLSCKPGGGFVLGASNAVQSEVPPANYRAMIEAWKEFGCYA